MLRVGEEGEGARNSWENLGLPGWESHPGPFPSLFHKDGDTEPQIPLGPEEIPSLSCREAPDSGISHPRRFRLLHPPRPRAWIPKFGNEEQWEQLQALPPPRIEAEGPEPPNPPGIGVSVELAFAWNWSFSGILAGIEAAQVPRAGIEIRVWLGGVSRGVLNPIVVFLLLFFLLFSGCFWDLEFPTQAWI